MKKLLALLLVSLMIFSLAACAAKTDTSNTGSPSSSPAPTADTSPASPPSSPSPTADTNPASPSPAETPKDTGPIKNPSANANSIGFFTDGVDPKSRDTYEIVWAYMRPMALFLNIRDALTSLEPVVQCKNHRLLRKTATSTK